MGARSRSSCSFSAQATWRSGETLGEDTSTMKPTAVLLAAAIGTTQPPSDTPQMPTRAGSTSGRVRRNSTIRSASSASSPKSRSRKL